MRVNESEIEFQMSYILRGKYFLMDFFSVFGNIFTEYICLICEAVGRSLIDSVHSWIIEEDPWLFVMSEWWKHTFKWFCVMAKNVLFALYISPFNTFPFNIFLLWWGGQGEDGARKWLSATTAAADLRRKCVHSQNIEGYWLSSLSAFWRQQRLSQAFGSYICGCSLHGNPSRSFMLWSQPIFVALPLFLPE